MHSRIAKNFELNSLKKMLYLEVQSDFNLFRNCTGKITGKTISELQQQTVANNFEVFCRNGGIVESILIFRFKIRNTVTKSLNTVQ